MAPRAPGPDFSSSAPTASDLKAMKRRARQTNDAEYDAYQRGKADKAAGHPRGHTQPLEAEHADAYNIGYDDEPEPNRGGPTPPSADSQASNGPAPAPSATTPARRGGSALLHPGAGKAESGAGLVLGMIAYALAINYLRGGLPAVKGWFGAKFLNHPYGGALNAAAYTAPAQPAQPVPNVPVGPPIGVPSVIQSQAGP